MTRFPTMVYRVPGNHKRPKGGTYSYRGAKDQAEFDALLAKGWYPSYDEAVAGKQAKKAIEVAEAFDDAIDEVSEPTREELEAKAKQLGVSFNSRTSDRKLLERIADALEV
jgi:hypothetical protein